MPLIHPLCVEKTTFDISRDFLLFRGTLFMNMKTFFREFVMVCGSKLWHNAQARSSQQNTQKDRNKQCFVNWFRKNISFKMKKQIS